MKYFIFLLSFFTLISLSHAQAPTNGLVAYYPFNGNANDESGNGNNGVVNGATLTADRFGNVNKSYSFNGNSSIVISDNDYLELTNNFSISSWFYATSLSQVSMILSKHICTNTEGTYTYGIWSNGVNNLVNFQAYPNFNALTYPTNAGAVNLNSWYNFVTTYDKTTKDLKYYLNGDLISTIQIDFNISNTTRDLFIGMQNCGSGAEWYWNGKIDDIRIYNRDLSNTEVQQLYQEKAPPVTLQTGLIAYYPFNGNANDESGNGNNGNVFGVTNTTDRFGNTNSAYDFNGTSNYIDVPDANSLDLTTEATLSVWVYETDINLNPSQDALNGRIIEKGFAGIDNGYLLDAVTSPSIGNTNYCSLTGTKVRFIGGGGAMGNSCYSLKAWHHIVGISDNGLIKIYIDGQLDYSSPSNSGKIIPTNDLPLRIGYTQGGFGCGCEYFKGKIDDIRIYNRALSPTEVQQLYTPGFITITQPQITLSSSTVATGGTMTINGKSFSSNKKAYLQFFGAGGYYRDSLITNAQGSWSYTYTAPNNPSLSQNGASAVRVTDQFTNEQSNIQTFYIIAPPVVKPNYIIIRSPTGLQSYKPNTPFLVQWEDKLVSGSVYPMLGTSAYRRYNYKIEYQVNNGAWVALPNRKGFGLLNSTVTLNMAFTPKETGSYVIRITDAYDPTIERVSNPVLVQTVTSQNLVQTEMLWDKSCPTPAIAPKGVAADGVGRLYLRLSKIVPISTTEILNVSVKLSDNANNTLPQYLGKVMKATITDTYSTEANAANTTSANNTNSLQSAYNFWYVAPDDFTTTSADSLKSVRIVNAIFTTSINNGLITNDTLKIEVVRPPLMLVHGLGGNDHTWDNLNFDFQGQNHILSNASMFRYHKAIKMLPHANFTTNALGLLTEGGTVPGITQGSRFHEMVESMRQMGYATNQVDYVCHSMGGCVLRTAEGTYADQFYGKGIYQNRQYKNYQKGFVHKAITINTPHKGSPWGDVIENNAATFNLILPVLDAWRKVNPNATIFSFIEPSVLFNVFYASTDAVKDLRLVGGAKLSKTNTRTHLIAGEIFPITGIPANLKLEFDEDLFDFSDNLLTACWTVETDPIIKAKLSTFKKMISSRHRAILFMEYEASLKVPVTTSVNAFTNGDGIVALNSQLAGVPSSPNRTIFKGWETRHTNITDITKTGNKVFSLLNSNVNSNLFDVVQASALASPSPQEKAIQNNVNTTEVTLDTNKIKIDFPIKNTQFEVDSTMSIKLHVKDTTNLAFVELFFQGKTYTSFAKNFHVNFNVNISPNYIGKQEVRAYVYYDNPNKPTTVYWDSIVVNVRNKAIPTAFIAKPKLLEMTVQNINYLNYTAIFPKNVAIVSRFDDSLFVKIADPNIVSLDPATHGFKGLTNGSTFAAFSYRGQKDTVYINVSTDTTKVTVDTKDISEIEKQESLKFVTFPNPTQGEFTLAVENLTLENAKVTVFNLIGQVIKEQQLNGKSTTIDLSGQAQGIYFVRLRTEKYGENTEKIQKY